MFSRIGYVAGVASKLDSRGFVPADFDRDGDIDFFVTANNQPVQYFENTYGEALHWVAIQLEGVETNSFGIGARIELTSAGQKQVREMHLGSGYLSSPAPEAHFGLGDATQIERIEVIWPTGERTVVENVEGDAIVRIREDGESTRIVPRSSPSAGS